MSTVISIENLSKKYVLSHQPRERYMTLRDTLSHCTKNAIHSLSSLSRPPASMQTHDEFWALKGINLDIQQGDRIGIIGRNGAGKSTLLKIISRITEPTTGRIRIRGRVASLLEVGTGFHPELTGRENIFLNGSIIGMRKTEIKRKFDEIVAFADVERFLDTPIKRYSSGMQVRLAFAVAAHLDSEIMVVDEVLAVGDARFHKKCLGKIGQMEHDGRTILFVSHQMALISSLCQSCVLLQDGKILFQGNTSEAIIKYYEDVNDAYSLTSSQNAFESTNAKFLGVVVEKPAQHLDLTIHDHFSINMKYQIKQSISGCMVPNFHFFSSDGNYAFVSSPESVGSMPPGIYTAKCNIPAHLLNDGTYFIGVALTHHEAGSYQVEFFNRNALTIHIVDPMDEFSRRYGYVGPIPGVIRPELKWELFDSTMQFE